MSTNYYAIVRLPTMHDEDEDNIFRFHIGKTGAGATVNGNQFRSFAEMVAYLSHTEAKIIDEYHTVLDLNELLNRFESYDVAGRRRQYDWVVNAAVHSDQAFERQWAKDHANEYWVDDEGYTLCKGAFA